MFQFSDPPTVTLDSVSLTENEMTVSWIYEENLRKKRKTVFKDDGLYVGVAVQYKLESEESYIRHPETGSVPADSEEKKLIIEGLFDVEATYLVQLLVYEGDLDVPSVEGPVTAASPPPPPPGRLINVKLSKHSVYMLISSREVITERIAFYPVFNL